MFKRGVRVGLLKNFQKVISKNKPEQSLNFPSVIEDSIKPADVSVQPNLEIKPVEEKRPEVKPVKEVKTIEIAPKELPDLPGDGFFLHLYGQLKAGKLEKDKLSAEDLVKSMQEYWHNDENLIKHSSVSEQNKWMIEHEISDTMEKLTVLEQQWKMKKIKVEQLKRDLELIEKGITEESISFKKLMKKLKFHQEVSQDQFFKLFSGREIKSLNELMGALKMMDDASFLNHVTGDRNDFADWVLGALKEKTISLQMRSVKTRKELISFLEENIRHEPAPLV